MVNNGSFATRRRLIQTSLAVFAAILVLTIISSSSGRHAAFPNVLTTSSSAGGKSSASVLSSDFVKPNNVSIIGLVFFGRKSTVEILRCYLEKNLAVNGGWLDEIHWVQNTENVQDLEYLDEILATSPYFKKVQLEKVAQIGGNAEEGGLHQFENIWQRLERGKLYVKIDDDVVWFEDTTIPSLVTKKLAHPEYVLVSANMINNPLMGWVHYHMGALHPYLPDLEPSTAPEQSLEATSLDSTPPATSFHSWRFHDYPMWQGPDDYVLSADQEPPPAGTNQRWLRLMDASSMNKTPIVSTEYNTWGRGWTSWAIAAQHHYSLLENLAEDRLDRYKFGKAWTTDPERLSINFVVLWADEVLDNLPMDDIDEPWLTISLPKKLGKNVAVDSEALAAHFSFSSQPGVRSTDLLARYHSYAAERGCKM